MAVSTTNAYDGPFSANGVTLSFPFTFTAQSTADVAVLLDDQPITAGYTVELYEGGGGTVTFAAAPGPGKLVVWLDPDFTQTTAFENGSAWLAAPVNLANDRAALRDQALSRDLKRCMRIPLGENAGTLPSAAKRKGKFFAFSPIDGTAVLADAVNSDALLRSDMASTDANKGATLVGIPGGGTLNDVIVPCATRSALATRTNRAVMAYLLETGRQGYFYFSTDNLASAVTADTAQAFYIPPSTDRTGASGAWVRAATRTGTADLMWFGAKGDGVDDTAALQAAISWLNAVRGRTLQVPVGTFTFTSDLLITMSSSRIEALGGGQCRLRGSNGARIVLGQAIPTVDAAGKVTKTGTKVSDCSLAGLSIQPADNHAGECVLVDYADSTLIEKCNIGPFNNNGSAVTIGIKTNWVQWLYIDRNQINVNGVCLWLRQPATRTQNEDHYHITRNLLYNGKVPPTNGFTPANIVVDSEAGSTYSIFEFELRGNHIGKFMSGSTAATTMTGGLRLLGADTTGDSRAFHACSIRDNFFEYVNYPIDMQRGLSGATDTSAIDFSGNAVLSATVVLHGSGTTKAVATLDANYFLQCDTLVDGIKCLFNGYNRYSAIGTLAAQSISQHRITHKQTGGGSLPGVRLEARGTAAVAAGQTYLDISHGLSLTPTDFNVIPTSSGWAPNFWISAAGATTFRINFTDPGASKYLRWTASVADA
ncbi:MULTISPECIES: hypothetical protein [unclassified Novosphingobium]|uniref:hypothetical protein n=1 Tax=unclassified Novosphingobium TaxID=2644732 RepID=UPI00146C9A6A|nr:MULTISPECIES: hypothetical protein [unclassified Novosphingobium]NMN07205.1 hypothetical protein [Novosphingobium sp. SG919]NMN89207.1 hypothetical protein [Novosphingobium sp. SG916]